MTVNDGANGDRSARTRSATWPPIAACPSCQRPASLRCSGMLRYILASRVIERGPRFVPGLGHCFATLTRHLPSHAAGIFRNHFAEAAPLDGHLLLGLDLDQRSCRCLYEGRPCSTQGARQREPAGRACFALTPLRIGSAGVFVTCSSEKIRDAIFRRCAPNNDHDASNNGHACRDGLPQRHRWRPLLPHRVALRLHRQ